MRGNGIFIKDKREADRHKKASKVTVTEHGHTTP